MRPKKLCLVIAAAATLAKATFALLPNARADLLDLLGLDGEFTQDDLAAGLADCQEHEACVTVCGRHCYGEHLEGNPAAIKAIASTRRNGASPLSTPTCGRLLTTAFLQVCLSM